MSIKGVLAATSLATGLLLIVHEPIYAAPAANQAATAKPTTPAVDADALDALSRMGDYLRSLNSFEVRADTVREEVDDRDQKLQFLGTTTYKAKRPNALAVDVAEDRKVRHFVYDGKSATLLAPRMGFYTTIAAPPTIHELLDVLKDKYGVQFPLEDLFLWGTADDGRADLKRGYAVGSARINGQDAEHYAFRQDNLDWQIWIARGPKPVPLRIVITGTDDPKILQMEASLTLNETPQFAADTFVFKAPPGAKAITIATIKN